MSLDPWERFVRDEPGSEVAGYFERAAPDGHGGTAWWFHDGAERIVADRSTHLADLDARTRPALSRRGGAVLGYVTFDAVGLFEPALARFPSGSPFPLGEMAVVRSVRSARVPPRRRAAVADRTLPRPLEDSLPRPLFERGVRRLVREIRDGEAFQVVLAHRRAWPRPADLLDRATVLRSGERYAFFYYLKFGDRAIVGATPESVVEQRRDLAWVDPIAGTIPRGRTGGRAPLRRDPKELAEHRMLVDLARNDLGAVARAGSVHLVWKERRMRYARLDHLVSRVAATVPGSRGPWTTLASTFPAGTVSGAPKIRAVELLREVEGTWRGPYAGTVGLLLPNGQASWALAIRTAFAARDRLYTCAGAGIVHRSEPAREWDETLAKLSLIESVFVEGSR